MKVSSIRTLAHALVLCALAACGGGGGEGGIGGTGVSPQSVSIGTITQFGSVWVNGVEFDDSAATIKRDDNVVTQAELRVGMVARVDGSIADKTAKTITVDSAAKGRVESAPSSTQMVVMGQTITISGSTAFENNQRPALGDYVEVHGPVVSDGVINAGFVEKKAFASQFAVKGFVRNHTAGGTTFTIGSLNVTLGSGAIVSDMPAGKSWNGMQVEVKGTACAGNPVCGTLTASKVEPEDLQGDVDQVELESFVTAINVDGFNLGAQKVVTNGSTVYEGGVASDVVVGTEVEVEGALSGGVLTARKVSFRENARLEGNATVNVAGSTLTLAGLGSVTVEVNAQTRISDFASLAAIPAGSHIEVRGRPVAGNDHVVATEIKAGGGNTGRVILQAAVASAANPILTLLTSVVVDTTPMTSDNQFHDASGLPIGRTAFFAAVTKGTLVKARGTLNGASVSWNDEIELEK